MKLIIIKYFYCEKIARSFPRETFSWHNKIRL